MVEQSPSGKQRKFVDRPLSEPIPDSREARLKHLQLLESAGINAYPAVPPELTHKIGEVKDITSQLAPGEESGQDVQIAGRIISKRGQGGIVFLDVEDYGVNGAKIQVMRRKQGEEDKDFGLIKEAYDTGDFIAVQGEVIRTKRGEDTVNAEEMTMLAKALVPPPINEKKGGGVSVETARRQRYLELMSDPNARDRFRTRERIMQGMREQFQYHGFFEVETPVLDTVYGGADAKPFVTHMKALDEPMYLRIANELYLKRLVPSMGPVFEFSRNFRNEGIDATHNPEFTAVEAYKPFSDYLEMMEMAEQMMERIVMNIHGTTKVKYGDHEIDFKAPWRRLTITDGFTQAYGVSPEELTDEQLLQMALEKKIKKKHIGRRGDMILGLFEHHWDDKLIQPTFVMDYPKETSSLAKPHRDNPDLAERFECVVGGLEVMNCYTELNDPRIQRENFEMEEERRRQGNDEAPPADEDFLVAMEYGFPPMGGIGISVDRFAMLLTGSQNIKDVIFFPPVKRASSSRVLSPGVEDQINDIARAQQAQE